MTDIYIVIDATQNVTSGSNQIKVRKSHREKNSQLIWNPIERNPAGFQPGRDLRAINLSLTLCPSLQESGSDL